MLAKGDKPEQQRFTWTDKHQWPDDLYKVIYIDHFGNCICGVRAGEIDAATSLMVAGHQIEAATTFSDVPEGSVFWYENANSLVEIAVNQGHAADQLELTIGSKITIL
jgi:hypothetical protein